MSTSSFINLPNSSGSISKALFLFCPGIKFISFEPVISAGDRLQRGSGVSGLGQGYELNFGTAGKVGILMQGMVVGSRGKIICLIGLLVTNLPPFQAPV